MKLHGVVSLVLCVVSACSAGDDEAIGERDERNERETHESSPFGCSGAQTLTPEQWEKCIAPRNGPHAVDSRDCEGAPIDQQYQVEPAIHCRVSPGDPRRRCGIGTYCTSHSECTAAPHGRCTGVASANCNYGNENLIEPCDGDAACGPGGRCIESRLDQGERCYPTGVCAPIPQRVCFYPESPCDEDSDCTAAPGGVCRKLIRHTACGYYGCLADADCGPSERCGCRTCVPSTCSGDQECGAGQSCRLGIGCSGRPNGFHCSSRADTCVTSNDCRDKECAFNGTNWQCSQEFCPSVE